MVDDEDSPSRISRSISARFRRKEQVARGEQVAETREEEEAALAAVDQPIAEESEEDAALDDDQLLDKYGLTNPEEIEDEAGLEAFMENRLPDRLRQMALRRMWRLNPLFRFADEMVEYGEDYTDAATVIDGMTTAYQVGKGYLKKAFDALDDEEEAGKAALPDTAEASAQSEAATGDSEPGEAENQTPETAQEDDSSKDSTAEAAKADSAKADSAKADSAKADSAKADSGVAGESAPEVSDAEISLDPEAPPRPRPQRMTFRRSAG